MTVFVIADVKVTDNSWVPNYAANVATLCISMAVSIWREVVTKTVEGEGLDTTLIALIQFPSMEAVQAFAGDPDYAPYAEARQNGSVSRLHVICNTDLAGMIDYLPKG